MGSDFDPATLADKIRQIYVLAYSSPAKLILSSEDEENVQQLCLKACEPAMLQLLEKTNAVPYLPKFIRSYVTSLNTLATEVDKLELPEDLCHILKKMLDLRRALLEADWFAEATMDVSYDGKKRDNGLLNSVCDSHSSICDFQTLSYQQLNSNYLDLDRCTPAQYSILEALWIKGDDLRLLINKYHLPLMTTDWLKQENVVNFKLLTKSQIDCLIACHLKRARASYEQATDFQTKQSIVNSHDEFKANVRNLYQNEVLIQPTVYEAKVRQQRAQINQALVEIESIDRTATLDKTELRQKLIEIGDRLYVHWHFSKEEMNMVNELFGHGHPRSSHVS